MIDLSDPNTDVIKVFNEFKIWYNGGGYNIIYRNEFKIDYLFTWLWFSQSLEERDRIKASDCCILRNQLVKIWLKIGLIEHAKLELGGSNHSYIFKDNK